MSRKLNYKQPKLFLSIFFLLFSNELLAQQANTSIKNIQPASVTQSNPQSAANVSEQEKEFLKAHICDVAQVTPCNFSNFTDIKPTRLNADALSKVFLYPFYKVQLIFPDSTTYIIVMQKDGKLALPPEGTQEQDMPQFLHLLNPSFRLKTEADGELLQAALNLIYPTTRDSDNNVKNFFRANQQWIFVMGKFFKSQKGFVFNTNSDGAIISAGYTLDIRPHSNGAPISIGASVAVPYPIDVAPDLYTLPIMQCYLKLKMLTGCNGGTNDIPVNNAEDALGNAKTITVSNGVITTVSTAGDSYISTPLFQDSHVVTWKTAPGDKSKKDESTNNPQQPTVATPPRSSSALTCADITKQLSSLDQGKPSPNMESFKSLDWFTKTLGAANFVETTYKWKQWPDFTLSVAQNGKGTGSSGDTPPALAALKTPKDFIFIPTIAQATQALGAPDSTVVSKKYTWNCPQEKSNSSMINIHLDSSNNITWYEGFCGYADCAGGNFEIWPGQIETLKTAASAPMVAPSSIAAHQDDQATKLLKKEFNLDVQGHAKIESAVITLLNNYFSSLQKCTVGSYKYLAPNPLSGFDNPSKSVPENLIPPSYILKQATIQGFKGNLCVVKEAMIMPGSMTPSGTDEKIIEDCQFKSEDLSVFTLEEAQFTGSGGVNTERPASKVINSFCKIENL